MSHSSYNEALSRASDCASWYQTECLISPEVGLSVPAAFVYDHLSGMKMITAPKAVNSVTDKALVPSSNATVAVAVHNPNTSKVSYMSMKQKLQVEYVDIQVKDIVIETLSTTASYCVQLLWRSYNESCWNNL
jgi:hypothetical protein